MVNPSYTKPETASAHKKDVKKDFDVSVITISSSRFEYVKRNKSFEDASGEMIIDLLKEAGHRIASYDLLPDNRGVISEKVLEMILREDVDAVITSGGTGLSPRDVTIEAVKPLLRKEMPGFGELFRMKSMEQIGSAVVLSRAAAGVLEGSRKGMVIFCLPGSPNAVELAMKEIIIPEIPHIMRHVRE